MSKMGFGRIIRPEGTSEGPPDKERERRSKHLGGSRGGGVAVSPQRRHLPAELARALELVALARISGRP